jgi:hypothetical protein
MFNLNLSNTKTHSCVQTHPSTHDYELTPTSSDDSDTGFEEFHGYPDKEMGTGNRAFVYKKNRERGSFRRLTRRAKAVPTGAVSRDTEKSLSTAEQLLAPMDRPSTEEGPVTELQQSLAQEDYDRRENLQRRIEDATERGERVAALDVDRGAACLRHCGTSCGSVIWQSFCACLAIAGAFWVGFVVLSFVEIIGISSLPPGIKYGAKVGDVYRA